MSEVVRDRAFEPFFTTKALGQGQGLGLSQVYGFVQQIGGAVRIDSLPGGGGNTVRMLPAVAPALPAAPAEAGGGQALPRVLVVVDDAERRQLLLSALTLQGYVQAVDAASARQRLEHNQHDVVVLGLPARSVSPDDLARCARRLRPGVGVVRLDSLGTSPQTPLDMGALMQAIRRAAPPLRA